MFHGLSNLSDIELMLSSLVVLTYMWDLKMVMYSIWIELLLIMIGGNKYSQDKYHDISWDWECDPYSDPKDM